MQISIALRLALVALGAVFASKSASAEVIYGGGATFPSVAYRNLFDCLTHQPTGAVAGYTGPPTTPLSASCAGLGPNYPHDAFLFMYAPVVDSGAGKAGFTAHSVRVPSWANLTGPIPYTDYFYAPGWPYPSIQFAGSDDLLLSSDVATYNTNSGPAKYGNILFMPAVVGPVAISINPTKDGNGSPWLVAPNAIKLSRKSICGIFSGHIKAWDATSITADNGTVIGHGPITVTHRSDGSGTNFLLTNGLTQQCRAVFGANKDDGPSPSDTTLSLYSFPWTDNGVPASQCPALPAVGANLNNWPDSGFTDQCGGAPANPAGGTFVAKQGNAGVAAFVVSQNGAIGYNSADQVQPMVPTGQQTAMLQSQYDIDNSTGAYAGPTIAGAQAAMSASNPVFASAADRANPLNWAAQGTVPNPVLPGSYPIAGFSWLLFYQCYASAAVASGVVQYITWHYSNPIATAVLGDNAMAVPPAAWVNQISTLITSTSPIGYHGDGGACNVKSGA